MRRRAKCCVHFQFVSKQAADINCDSNKLVTTVAREQTSLLMYSIWKKVLKSSKAFPLLLVSLLCSFYYRRAAATAGTHLRGAST